MADETSHPLRTQPEENPVMIDSALQRSNMVESQIRPSDVTDRRILRAMAEVARELFVPESVRTLAYMDSAVPLEPARRASAACRALMPPRTFAKLVQLAEIEATDSVLIVGVGMGYSAAVVSRIAARVVGLECDPELASRATIAVAEIGNVSIVTGPLAAGLPDRGPYQVIIVDGAVGVPPSALLAQIAPGGRLVAVMTQDGVPRATLWRRIGNQFGEMTTFEAPVAILPGFEPVNGFVL